MSIPNRFDIVQAVNAEHPRLIQENTRETVREFMWRVVAKLAEADPRFGFLSKSPGENHIEIPGAGRVSVDAIAYEGEHNVVDIIIGAGDAPNPGRVSWQEGHERRPSNLWVKAVPFGGAPDPPPPPPPPPPDNTEILKRIGEIERRLAEIQADISGAALDAADALAMAKRVTDRLASLKLVAAPELPDSDAISTNQQWGHAHRFKARVV